LRLVVIALNPAPATAVIWCGQMNSAPAQSANSEKDPCITAHKLRSGLPDEKPLEKTYLAEFDMINTLGTMP
jgi:hypothetical protein